MELVMELPVQQGMWTAGVKNLTQNFCPWSLLGDAAA